MTYELGCLARGRVIIGDEDAFELRERVATYDANIALENDGISPQNLYFLEHAASNVRDY